MPEATVLYTVTAVVIAALVLWVAVVLKTAKQPWARAVVQGAAGVGGLTDASDDSPQIAAAEVKVAPESEPELAESSKGGPQIDADSTAKATPVALANKAKSGAGGDEKQSADDDKRADAKDAEA